MLKLILKSLLISMLLILTAFADDDDTLSPFNQQGDDLTSPKPNSEESFFATRAPMEAVLRRYFGLNLGMNFATLKPTIVATNSRGANVGNQALSPTSPFISYSANLYGGLGTNFDHFYVGSELSGGYNTLKRSIHTTNFTTNNATITFKQPLNFGFDFMPGYITSQKDFIFYGRLGIGTSLFKIRMNDDSGSSHNKFIVCWRAGLGVEYFISESFSTRLDYIYSDYHNINYQYTSGVDSNTYSYKISSPHTQQVNLGVSINL